MASVLIEGAEWRRDGVVWYAGRSHLHGTPLTISKLRELAEQGGAAAVLDAITQMRGFFAVVVRVGPDVVAAVDHVRSYPLFYAGDGPSLVIGTNPDTVAAATTEVAPDRDTAAQYRLSRFVVGSSTLLRNVYQLQAGELLHARDGEPRFGRYYIFEPRPTVASIPVSELAATHERHLTAAFDRMWEHFSRRPVIIPLSGGYDSRLVACMIQRYGYRSILAITYGKRGSREVAVASALARGLGLSWRHIEYDTASWRRLAGSEDWEGYLSFAHRRVSVPHIQDLLALWMLKRQGEIPDDSIVVPGHTGDFISGGHITPRMLGVPPSKARDRIVTLLLDKHFRLMPHYRTYQALKSRYADVLLEACGASHNADMDVVTQCERFDWQERQAKFIVNSVRVYDYFGLGWWLPLWDRDLVSFWSTVPLSMRIKQRLYRLEVERLCSAVTVQGRPVGTAVNPWANLAQILARQFRVYDLARSAARRVRGRTDYDTNPLAIYGFLTRERFDETYDYRGVNGIIADIILDDVGRKPSRIEPRP